MQKLQVYLPYDKKFITQRFGENGNPSYARDGLKGHTAYDWGVPWGTPIPNCVEGLYVYSLLNKDNPDPTRYRAVCGIVETDNGGVYEITYGHCSAITAEVGKTYKVGDVIAKVGNTGDVWVGAHEVTKAERQQGSQAGAHLHGPQIRVLKKTRYTSTYKNYLYDDKGFLCINGWYYGVPDYDNGYNGCVSLRSFSTEKVAVSTDPIQVVAKALPVVQEGVAAIPTTPEPQKATLIEALSKLLTGLNEFMAKLSTPKN